MGTFKFAKTVIRSMFTKPATRMYPVIEREWEERTRGAVEIDTDSCILCSVCAMRCPTDAIEVSRKGSTWEIKRMQCIQCGACVESCPKKCLTMDNRYTTPDYDKIIDLYDIGDKDKNVDEKKETLNCHSEDCVYCGLCVKVCPTDALNVDRKSKLWEVQDEKCVRCGACVEKCPKKCLEIGVAEDEGTATDVDGTQEASNLEDKLVCGLEECIFCGICAKNCPVDAIEVERKEKIWKVDDSVCIKCGVCVEKCPKKCLRIGKPEDDDTVSRENVSQSPEEHEKKETRSLPHLDEDECLYCRACENQCPTEAIVADVDDWQLDEEKCTGCETCVEVCPADALEMREKQI